MVVGNEFEGSGLLIGISFGWIRQYGHGTYCCRRRVREIALGSIGAEAVSIRGGRLSPSDRWLTTTFMHASVAVAVYSLPSQAIQQPCRPQICNPSRHHRLCERSDAPSLKENWGTPDRPAHVSTAYACVNTTHNLKGVQ